jgi:hypothetical protein
MKKEPGCCRPYFKDPGCGGYYRRLFYNYLGQRHTRYHFTGIVRYFYPDQFYQFLPIIPAIGDQYLECK